MAAKTINYMIGIEIYGWPPVCIGMLFQPTRPKKKPETSTIKNKRQMSFR